MDRWHDLLHYFAEKLETEVPEFIDSKGVMIEIEGRDFHLEKQTEEYLTIATELCTLQHPLTEEHMRLLLSSHFLGLKTHGCLFYLNPKSTHLCMRTLLHVGIPPQEGWEWLERLFVASLEWRKILSEWKEEKAHGHN